MEDSLEEEIVFLQNGSKFQQPLLQKMIMITLGPGQNAKSIFKLTSLCSFLDSDSNNDSL